MSIFKKRGPELIDLTQLQKKGTLQRSQRIAKNNKDSDNTQDVVDLTIKKSETALNSLEPSPQPYAEIPSSAMGDFLSNLASLNSSKDTSIPSASLSSAISKHPLNPGKETSLDIQSLKIKLDDIEFKLDNFISRLNKIEEKLGKV